MITNKEKSILSLLKESTQINHDATEAVALSNKIATGTLQLAEYQNLLLCNWHIHQQLTNSFLEGLDKKAVSAIDHFVDNKRVLWLEADLKELNIPINKIALVPEQIPTYSSIPALIGGLYVVEGSMLGGQFICKRLRENMQLQAVQSFRFYEGYGPATGKRWAAFRQLAIQEVNTTDAIDVCIAAAKKTFTFFETSYQLGITK